MEHLKFLGATIKVLIEVASLVDVAVKDVKMVSLTLAEQVGVSTLFG